MDFGTLVLFVLVPLITPRLFPVDADARTANFAPADSLVFVAWSGRQSPDLEPEHPLTHLLTDPKVTPVLDALHQRLADPGPLADDAGPTRKLVELLTDLPGAWYVSRIEIARLLRDGMFDRRLADRGEMSLGHLRARGGLRIPLGERRGAVELALNAWVASFGDGLVTKRQIDGRDVYQVRLRDDPTELYFGLVGEDLIAGYGEGEFRAIIRRLEGPPPDWYSQAIARSGVPRRATFLYCDASRLIDGFRAARPNSDPLWEVIGLDQVNSVSVITGLDGDVIKTEIVLQVDRPATGLLSLADADPISPETLERVGQDVMFAGIVNVDPSTAWERISDAILLDPNREATARNRERFRHQIKFLEQKIGLDLENDVLACLGKTWLIQGGFEPLRPRGTLSIALANPQKFQRAHDHLFAAARENLAAMRDSGADLIPSLASDAVNGHRIHSFQLFPRRGGRWVRQRGQLTMRGSLLDLTKKSSFAT